MICSFNVLCHIKGQKRGPMKSLEVFKNLIVDIIIFLYVLKLKSSEPYRRIFKSFLWDKFSKIGFKTQISLRSSAIRSELRLQRKRYWSVVSRSRPWLHIGSMIALLCQNLCSFKWLKCSLRRFSSFIPFISWILKIEFSLGLMKLSIFVLSWIVDLIPRSSSLRLFHSLIQ